MDTPMTEPQRYSSLFWLVFLGIALLHLAGEGWELHQLTPVTKPLLLFSLGFYFFTRTSEHRIIVRKWILAALIFSWTGDIILLWSDDPQRGVLFFLLGLGAFLIAHLAYVMGFRAAIRRLSDKPRQNWHILPFLALLLGFLYLLWPGLGPDFKFPVTIYGAVIVTMVYMAFVLNNRWSSGWGRVLLAGACLFMVSDMILGYCKFLAPGWPEWAASFAIMLTYIAGQALIVRAGVVLVRDLDRTPVAVAPNGKQ